MSVRLEPMAADRLPAWIGYGVTATQMKKRL